MSLQISSSVTGSNIDNRGPSNLKKGRWVMGTRVKVFTVLLNLGHEKVRETLWQVCNGNIRWQRGSLCFAEQFVRHRKKLLSGRADVYLAAVVKLLGFLYASLHRGPLLDEDFPVDSQAS